MGNETREERELLRLFLTEAGILKLNKAEFSAENKLQIELELPEWEYDTLKRRAEDVVNRKRR